MKDAREISGKGLKEIADATRIKSSYLKAIEEGDFKRLPVEVYTRSYIREYARYLNVSPNESLAEYEKFLSEKHCDKTLDVLSEEQSKTKSSETSLDKPSQHKVPFLKIAAVLVAMISVGLFFYWLQSGQRDAYEMAEYKPPPITTQQTQEKAERPQEPLIQTSNPTAEKGTTLMPENTLANAKIEPKPEGMDSKVHGKHTLQITATDKVWFQVMIDGKEKKEALLNPGDEVAYSAEEFFSLLIGNAGGVRIRLDDKQLDALGEKGAVIKLRLPKSSSNT